eukprot:Lankesteria_metandrocarpae@DN780_c0_g1_i1.p1
MFQTKKIDVEISLKHGEDHALENTKHHVLKWLQSQQAICLGEIRPEEVLDPVVRSSCNRIFVEDQSGTSSDGALLLVECSVEAFIYQVFDDFEPEHHEDCKENERFSEKWDNTEEEGMPLCGKIRLPSAHLDGLVSIL